MAEKTRATVAAVLKETSGLAIPATGADFIPVQDGNFAITPNFETIENLELKGSIGTSKGIQGLEAPTAELSIYLKNSGVSGQAPNWFELLESAFGASDTIASEINSASGSTASILNVQSGGGASYERGHSVWLGSAIRPVDSIATDALTLGFQASSSPASGIALGLPVMAKPANEGHPTVSLWRYNGNGGAIEALEGGIVSEYSLEVTAGEAVNQSFSIEGTKYYFNPITITSSSRYIDFTVDSGTFAAILDIKTYRDPYELAAHIQNQMNALTSGGDTIAVDYVSIGTDAGKFTFTASGTAVFSLLWNSGTNSANSAKTKLGFANTNDTGSLTYKSDTVQSWAAGITPAYDSTSLLVAKNHEVLLGDSDNISCQGVQSFTLSLSNTIENQPDICAESGVEAKVINQREVTVDLTLTLKRHEAENFKKFRANENIKFFYAFGEKSGGNWVKGKSGTVYIPTAIVQTFEVGDENGIVVINMTLQAYVDDSGNGECYINFI